jgi:hypothetical protein
MPPPAAAILAIELGGITSLYAELNEAPGATLRK